MTHPFELTAAQLQDRLDEMVEVTFGDLQSQFLTLPRGAGFIDYSDFQTAYEVLKSRSRKRLRVSQSAVDGRSYIASRHRGALPWTRRAWLPTESDRLNWLA